MKRETVNRIEAAFLSYETQPQAAAVLAERGKEQRETYDFSMLARTCIRPAMLEISRFLASKGYSASIDDRSMETRWVEISMHLAFSADSICETAAFFGPKLSFRPDVSRDCVIVSISPNCFLASIERHMRPSLVNAQLVQTAFAELLEKTLPS